MISKEQGLKNKILLAISVLFTILTIIGIVASDGWERWVSVVALAIIVSLYFWFVFIWIPAKMLDDQEKELAPFKKAISDRENSFTKFVFPYIRSISASPIVCSNEDYIDISVYFPTSNLKEKELSLTGELIIDGYTSKKLETQACNITPDGAARISWRVELTNTLLHHVKQKVETNSPVQATLKLQDDSNREYSWETETWTTLLLTKTC